MHIGLILIGIIQQNVGAFTSSAVIFNSPIYESVPVSGSQILSCQLHTIGKVRGKLECAYHVAVASSEVFVYNEENMTCHTCSPSPIPSARVSQIITASVHVYVKGILTYGFALMF